uniref:DNA-directed RNA polymerase subunit n=1 Tax=Steinernema glaseri TaxID=37863 RepID=A0A1I8AIR6_9BILA
MLTFCPECGSLLQLDRCPELVNRFLCPTCPFVMPITKLMASKRYLTLKKVDDVLGGSAAWNNAATTKEQCQKCSHDTAYFTQIQTRSADEPMTTFYRCANPSCGETWKGD